MCPYTAPKSYEEAATPQPAKVMVNPIVPTAIAKAGCTVRIVAIATATHGSLPKWITMLAPTAPTVPGIPVEVGVATRREVRRAVPAVTKARHLLPVAPMNRANHRAGPAAVIIAARPCRQAQVHIALPKPDRAWRVHRVVPVVVLQVSTALPKRDRAVHQVAPAVWSQRLRVAVASTHNRAGVAAVPAWRPRLPAAVVRKPRHVPIPVAAALLPLPAEAVDRADRRQILTLPNKSN